MQRIHNTHHMRSMVTMLLLTVATTVVMVLHPPMVLHLLTAPRLLAMVTLPTGRTAPLLTLLMPRRFSSRPTTLTLKVRPHQVQRKALQHPLLMPLPGPAGGTGRLHLLPSLLGQLAGLQPSSRQLLCQAALLQVVGWGP